MSLTPPPRLTLKEMSPEVSTIFATHGKEDDPSAEPSAKKHPRGSPPLFSVPIEA